MHEQGLINPRRDPYNRQYGDHEYAYYREKRFEEDCRLNGITCDVHALDWDSVDKRYDYDRIHDEHYRGSPNDPYPHDVSHPKGYDPHLGSSYDPYDQKGYDPYLYPYGYYADNRYYDRIYPASHVPATYEPTPEGGG
jgi:hypothetical protein